MDAYHMHLKLTTYKPFWNAPHSVHYAERISCRDPLKYEMCFMEIAVTREEADILKEESWSHGVECTSCYCNSDRVI